MIAIPNRRYPPSPPTLAAASTVLDSLGALTGDVVESTLSDDSEEYGQ